MPRKWTEQERKAIGERSRKQWAALTDEQREQISEGRRNGWAKLTPEQRAARVASMHEAGRHPRSAEARRNAGEAKRRGWAEGRNRPHKSRICRGCEQEFQPASPPQRYCTIECRRRSVVAAKHGLNLRELDTILNAQGNVCAICGSEARGWSVTGRLVVDHCHTTGRVRGFLCGDCNTALGRFGDDPARLRAAADYLERPAL